MNCVKIIEKIIKLIKNMLKTKTKEIILLGTILFALSSLIIGTSYKNAMAEMELMEWPEITFVNQQKIVNKLPINEDKEYYEIYATIYGYSSEVSQTDDSPFITASGYNLVDSNSDTIANNCLSFGTIVVVSGVDKRYIVRDRMNSRYNCSTFDVWFPDRQSAINWGKKNLLVKIYE